MSRMASGATEPAGLQVCASPGARPPTRYAVLRIALGQAVKSGYAVRNVADLRGSAEDAPLASALAAV
jgi:hypothetical protein